MQGLWNGIKGAANMPPLSRLWLCGLPTVVSFSTVLVTCSVFYIHCHFSWTYNDNIVLRENNLNHKNCLEKWILDTFLGGSVVVESNSNNWGLVENTILQMYSNYFIIIFPSNGNLIPVLPVDMSHGNKGSNDHIHVFHTASV